MTAAIKHGEARVDALRPAVFDPADFEVVNYLDLDEFKDGGFHAAIEAWEQEIVAAFGERGRAFVEDGPDAVDPLWVCDHCGHYGLRYVGVVRQLSTDARFVFGSRCVARAELTDRAEWKLVQLRGEATARRERARLAEEQAHYLNDNEDLRLYLGSIPRGESGEPQHSFDFVNSMDRALARYGSLTEKQAGALRRVVAKEPERARIEQKFAERDARRGPAPTGRVAIEGEIVKVDWYDGYMGERSDCKMVVRLDNDSAIFVAVPQSLWTEHSDYADARRESSTDEPYEDLATWLHGRRVALTATFEVSDRDEHFAFGKRPSGARTID